MRSSLPKVLHPVAGQSLLAHVLDAAPHGTGAALAVVIGPDHKAVADEVKRIRTDAATFVQAERLGTAHAVLAARDGDRARRGRSAGGVRRYAADFGQDLCAAARAAGAGRRPRGARFPRRATQPVTAGCCSRATA